MMKDINEIYFINKKTILLQWMVSGKQSGFSGIKKEV
jgi:hypothetical protein